MKKENRVGRIVLTAVLIFVAALFVIPIVFTMCNSFMGSSEITANYGMIFETTDSGAKKFIADAVNLKFIPDKVSFSQYITVLLKSPDYLLKFWNSVILVVPIVVFQLAVALLASYSLTRFRGRIKEINNPRPKAIKIIPLLFLFLPTKIPPCICILLHYCKK